MTQISISSKLSFVSIAHNRFYRPLEDIKVGGNVWLNTFYISYSACAINTVTIQLLSRLYTKSLTCLVRFLQNAVTSIAKRKESCKDAKLNDDCCVGESQDIEERDSFQEAHEKKTCDRKRYKADPESKKDSMKAQYWLDPESKRESAKAQYWLDPESKKDSAKAQYCLDPESKKETAKAQYCRKRNTMR